MSRLSRREFVVGSASIGLLAGCGRWPGQAQESARVPTVGFLAPVTMQPRYEAFRDGLRDLGYVEGQSITIESRFAEGGEERLPVFATELAQLKVDCILAGGTSAALAAKQVTNTIPIVFGGSNEPVEAGLVASLARPGGNVTGLSLMNSQLSQKRLQLLQEAVGHVTRVAVLVYPLWATAERDWNETQVAAQALGLQLLRRDARGPDDLVGAVETAASQGADALFVMPTPFFVGERMSIIDLAALYRLPAMYEGRLFVEAGGLVAYGANAASLFRRAAYYVDRILKGTKPADLPVEQPMTFDFVVNLKTARELGLTFPNEILLQVTEVIE
jgi:putative tryptophan/tyrosine transport system substrate-binding protein